MRFTRYIIITAVIISYFARSRLSHLRPVWVSHFDIKKPNEYENRVLRSERSDKRNLGLPKRFIQNTITHYNYFFNANNKLNEVLGKAKAHSKMIIHSYCPFYNYSLDVTAADSTQLDSISL